MIMEKLVCSSAFLLHFEHWKGIDFLINFSFVFPTSIFFAMWSCHWRAGHLIENAFKCFLRLVKHERSDLFYLKNNFQIRKCYGILIAQGSTCIQYSCLVSAAAFNQVVPMYHHQYKEYATPNMRVCFFYLWGSRYLSRVDSPDVDCDYDFYLSIALAEIYHLPIFHYVKLWLCDRNQYTFDCCWR